MLVGVEESEQSKTRFINGRDTCLIGERVGQGKPNDPQTYITFVEKEMFEPRAISGVCIGYCQITTSRLGDLKQYFFFSFMV